MSAAYATAQLALRRRVGEEISRHQERILKRFSVEYLRISDDYAQVARELESWRRDGDQGRTQALEGSSRRRGPSVSASCASWARSIDCAFTPG